MDICENLEVLFEKIKKGKVKVSISDEGIRKVIGIGDSNGSLFYTEYDISLIKWRRSDRVEVSFQGSDAGNYIINTEEGKKIDDIFNEIWDWKQSIIDIEKQNRIDEAKKCIQQYVENCDKVKERDKEIIVEKWIIQKIKRWFGRG